MKYEYRTVTFPNHMLNKTVDQLNVLGQEGWMLVHVYPTGTALLMRAIPNC